MNLLDDNSPHPPTPDDTQPTHPLRIRRRRMDTWQWALAGIILLTSLTLLGTLGLALLAPAGPPDTTPAPGKRSVSVIDGGEVVEAETDAATVGDLLKEMSITVGPDDYVSYPLTTPLQKDMAIYIERARDVTLDVDGQTRVFATTYSNPKDILDAAGVSVDGDDYVSVDGTQTNAAGLLVWPVPATRIDVTHAMTLTVVDEGTPTTLRTTAATVGDALFQAGVTLYVSDVVEPDLSAPITPGMQVTITRSVPVTIVVDGATMDTRVGRGTVGDALAQAGVTLAGLDSSEPRESEDVFPGMVIRVVRVTEDLVTEQTPIDYQTIYQADASMELDSRMTLQAGQRGVQTTIYRVRYEDGVEVSREVDSTEMTQVPVNEIVSYGTNVVIRSVDTPDGPREYWRVIRMLATSYSPSALGGDNVTSIGATLTKGVVATHPDVIPYHTQVFVPGYGIGTVADTGAGPSSTRLWIDLGYDDDNYVPWSRRVNVYILTPVPPQIDYMLPN